MNLIIKLFNIFVKLVLNPKIFLLRINYEIKKIFFDVFFYFNKKYKFNIIFLAGMPMSATTKVKNMCGMIPGYFTRYSPIPYKKAVKQDITNSAFRYTPTWSYTLFKTHLNPSDENLEIIISDNCSQDNTKDIVEKFNYDPRIHFFQNEVNIGMIENFKYSLCAIDRQTFSV